MKSNSIVLGQNHADITKNTDILWMREKKWEKGEDTGWKRKRDEERRDSKIKGGDKEREIERVGRED